MANNRRSSKETICEVTEVRVFPVGGKSNLLANVGVTINDAIVIYVKLVENKKGDMFLSMPNHSYIDGRKTKYKDDVFFLDADLRDEVLNKIIDEYNKG